MLPSVYVRKGRQSRKPLRHLVDVVSVFLKELETGSAIHHLGIVDFVMPLDFELQFFVRKQRRS